MTLKEIVADWLRTHGYTGLYHADTCCGCSLDDFMPCGEPGENCQPGFLGPDTEDGYANCECGGGCRWAIYPHKPSNPNKKGLPSIEQIGGMDPDFTGGLSTEEYIRCMRGGRENDS